MYIEICFLSESDIIPCLTYKYQKISLNLTVKQFKKTGLIFENFFVFRHLNAILVFNISHFLYCIDDDRDLTKTFTCKIF